MAFYEKELLRRRRDNLIIRVDRADLSKNVLRGFTAFDVFLEQHPEFREKVTFIAHLQPSRQDVPEYAEYLERIEALVAVVNHRHGTTDWMPIDLRIYENFHEAVARYKHFDLLMVNSMFDGMNLVAKEAPAVNTRDGVVMLSENTGAHEELGDCALSVNPFDIQEQADGIHRALTMEPEERALRARRLQGDHHRARPGRLGRRAARRHPREARAGGGRLADQTGSRLARFLHFLRFLPCLCLHFATAAARWPVGAADAAGVPRGVGRRDRDVVDVEAAADIPKRPRRLEAQGLRAGSDERVEGNLDRLIVARVGVVRVVHAEDRAAAQRHGQRLVGLVVARADSKREMKRRERRRRERGWHLDVLLDVGGIDGCNATIGRLCGGADPGPVELGGISAVSHRKAVYVRRTADRPY